MSVRYKRDTETVNEIANLRKRRDDFRAVLKSLVDHYHDFGPDAAFDEMIDRIATKLDDERK